MKKIKKKKATRSKAVTESPPHALTWMGGDGIHFVAPGTPPSPAQLEEMTKKYQESIRNSPMWDEMVRKFGKEKAEELLFQCRAKLA
jgi:hypothetical protein